jgi:hypothetical protein
VGANAPGQPSDTLRRQSGTEGLKYGLDAVQVTFQCMADGRMLRVPSQAGVFRSSLCRNVTRLGLPGAGPPGGGAVQEPAGRICTVLPSGYGSRATAPEGTSIPGAARHQHHLPRAVQDRIRYPHCPVPAPRPGALVPTGRSIAGTSGPAERQLRVGPKQHRPHRRGPRQVPVPRFSPPVVSGRAADPTPVRSVYV